MAMYNEKESVEPVTSEIDAALTQAEIPYEIICVSNGSTDGTEEKLVDLSKKNSKIRPLLLKEKGYGRAVIAGMEQAQYEYIAVVVSDGQTPPKDIIKAYETISTTGADVIKPRRTNRTEGILRLVLVGIFNILVKILFSVPGWDIDGQPKVVRKDFLRKLKLESKDFFIDSEIIIKTRHLGGKTVEIPVEWRTRERGTPFIARALFRTSRTYLKNLIHWRIHYNTLVVQKLSSFKQV